MTLERKRINIPVGNFELEGKIGYKKAVESAPGIIICHPHPQFGGSMDNNVVWALFETFAGQGYVVLAFNFRGVGLSGGYYEEGKGEIQDVTAAVDWLSEYPMTKGCGIGLTGYSFGAWVGLQSAVKESRIQCLGAVAPPVAMYSFEFMAQYQCPLFIVSGSQDSFCPADQKEVLLSQAGGKRDWRILSGTDHFFINYEKEAAQYLCDHFLECLPVG